ALLAFLAWFFFGKRRAVAADSEITIVVDGGYAPDSIVARRGAPLRLVFDRRDTGPCTDEVVFPDFGIRRRLPTGQKTTISIVPETTGDFSWSCGMNMLHGRIRVVA
ncbi:MAG TPA: cupredoxin domain-containing protein, partial [Thermoanaerobaculia bacterium]|nr:cupredoxin domain-containing protein [Thermoanaerobaculia bacterium]